MVVLGMQRIALARNSVHWPELAATYVGIANLIRVDHSRLSWIHPFHDDPSSTSWSPTLPTISPAAWTLRSLTTISDGECLVFQEVFSKLSSG